MPHSYVYKLPSKKHSKHLSSVPTFLPEPWVFQEVVSGWIEYLGEEGAWSVVALKAVSEEGLMTDKWRSQGKLKLENRY